MWYTYYMVRSKQFTNQACSPELHLIDTISGKWTVSLIYILSENTMRHSELQRSINGISQKVLTQTLRNLERNGIVKRTVYPVVPPQVEYSLTPIGKSLVSVLSEVCLWAKEHYQEVDEARKKFDSAAKPVSALI